MTNEDMKEVKRGVHLLKKGYQVQKLSVVFPSFHFGR